LTQINLGHLTPAAWRRCNSRLVVLIFLAAYRDRHHVGAATGGKLTTGTGDHNNAIALALARNVTAPDLDVSEIAIPRHRCQGLVQSYTLKIHGWITSLRSKRGREPHTKFDDGIDLHQLNPDGWKRLTGIKS
jgi:hypothetical protein